MEAKKINFGFGVSVCLFETPEGIYPIIINEIKEVENEKRTP